jgi:hypothetical protein
MLVINLYNLFSLSNSLSLLNTVLFLLALGKKNVNSYSLSILNTTINSKQMELQPEQ